MQPDSKVIAAAILGVAIVVAAVIVGTGRQLARYEVTRSGFNNAVWLLDRKRGTMAWCGAYQDTGVYCREATKLGIELPAQPAAPAQPQASPPKSDNPFDHLDEQATPKEQQP